MPSAPTHYSLSGADAASLTRSVESAVISGALRPGDQVPSVRRLAGELGLSPTTVAAAYRDLRRRGVLVTHDRSRTVVAHRPPLAVRLAPELPPGTIDLATGNPDPDLLPDLAAPWASLTPRHRLYGTPVCSPALDVRAREDLADDGVPADHLAVVAGGLDGIERILEVHARPGDRVAVEDPAYSGTLDLLRALGLQPVGIAVDESGMLADELAAALERGVTNVIQVPRAQNPTGASLTAERAIELRDCLAAHPDVLVIEDDHLGPVSGYPYHRIADDRARWATVRSLAKSLGPDLRVAVVAGDADTITRVLGRQRLGTGWVSHLLQDLAAETWTRARGDGTLERATAQYARRREAVLDALAELGVEGTGRSGLNVWVRVAEEVPVVQGLAARGWAVLGGEACRMESPPAIRITTAALDVADVPALMTDLGDVLDRRLGTRRG